MLNIRGPLLGLALLAIATPVAAQDCKQLAIVTSVDLETNKEHDAVYAPVTMEGKPELLQVDTGANLSTITNDIAKDLSLDHEPVNVALIDVNGQISSEAGRVKSFTIGNLHASKVDFIISKSNPWGEGNMEIAGLLGADILTNYDLEIDFGVDKLTLLSPDHCEGKVIYWPAAAVAAVPMTLTRNGDITFTVTLDGKPVTATLDTGAYTTTLGRGYAESTYGLTGTSPGVSVIAALDKSHGSQVLSTHFKTLTFGDDQTGSITVSNPQVDLIANFMGNSGAQQYGTTASRLKSKSQAVTLPDMLLGMNVLRHLHIYIAYGEHKLYITPASAPAAKP
ncbi:MAG TPA: pepsin/retropepsin-like aspartic protease family protein [Rhizomicrobium sp.]|jgi:predicted aspartyl protease|nr:pepsin/retropepsin-like aspartic protease family protein [Acidisoma sp.]